MNGDTACIIFQWSCILLSSAFLSNDRVQVNPRHHLPAGGVQAEVGGGRVTTGNVQFLTCVMGPCIHGILCNGSRTEVLLFIPWFPNHFSPNVILSK